MKKILSIAQWEYLEKIKNKAFLFSIFLTPAIIIFFTLAPALFSTSVNSTTSAYAIADTSGIYFESLRIKLESHLLPNNQPKFICINITGKEKSIDVIKKHADKEIIANTIQGCLVIYNGGTDSVYVEFRTNTSSPLADKDIIQSDFNIVKNTYLLNKANISPDIADRLNNIIQLKQIIVSKDGKDTKGSFENLFFSSFILIMLLIMMILSTGGMLVRSLLEEKSNRLIEILISSCSLEELLAGKIIALSGLGLTQLAVWAIISISLNRFDVIPPETFRNIFPMLLYFTLGYIFYTAVFVGVGSIVTTEHEAQQMTSYISMLLILPTVFVVSAIQYPGSMLFKVLSYIPFTSTSVMLLRLKLETVPPLELALTIMIMLFSTYTMIVIASKIFKIGILSYGKRPTFKEIFRWVIEK